MFKTVALVISMFGMITAAYLELKPDKLQIKQFDKEGTKYNVRILRDTWGVPHIFGVTDADAAYGLAYAHSEDDFITIQRSMLSARGRMASVFGLKAVPNDYLVHLLRIWDIVNAKYDSEMSAETRAICKGYADGLNHYASLHPDEVLPGLFPVTGKDVVAGFVLKIPLFFGLHNTLKELYEPKRMHVVSTPPLVKNSKNSQFQMDWNMSYGSNTFSVAPSRSAEGKTLLAVNSHQPWEGPLTWYEAHLHSEEGWDMVGGVFPGTPVVLHGHNRHLGWAHTVNKPDLVDVYVLDINPENPNQYLFDGEWRELEVRTAAIKVKLIGPISRTINQEVLWSEYGPVVRRPHGTYAIRYAGYGEIRQIEQWYRMNKARNFIEWQDAMRLRAIPMFNCGYADSEGNILFLYNALLPIRDEGYDWSQYLPGNTSNTLWTDYLPFELLPQVKNPSSGFIQNCNSTPFQTTIGPDNPKPENYPQSFGIETSMTNRALRALELFGSDESITEKEFYQYKYDETYSTKSDVAMYVQQILNAPVPDDPIAQEALEVLRAWDLKTDPENKGAALAVLTLKTLFQNQEHKSSLSSLMETFVKKARELKRAYGRINVPWKTVNRLIRGKLNLGMGGAPDVLHAVYSDKIADGRLKGKVGDSYILLVSWDANGRVSSHSIHQYGSATIDKNSLHYADQAFYFTQRKLKPVWLDEADIRAHLEREYRPGDEFEQ
ncbi:MAG: acylase [bacterium]